MNPGRGGDVRASRSTPAAVNDRAMGAPIGTAKADGLRIGRFRMLEA
jgi:hypothetical protein